MVKKIELYDIIKKLTGSLEPIGETNYDAKVLKNLEELETALIPIITDLVETAKEEEKVEASMQKCGKKAKEILEKIIEKIGE